MFLRDLYSAVLGTCRKSLKYACCSSGSDLVDAERTGIKIVVAPYVLAIKDTSRFYKSGLPFDVTVKYINSTE